MRIIRQFILLTLFMLSLCGCYIFSTQTSPPQAMDRKTNVTLTDSKQFSILLVVCDRTTVSKPSLRSVWLILFVPDQEKVTYIPIFPATMKNYEVRDQILVDSFYLGKNGAPSTQFLDNVKNLKIHWDHFLIIDEGFFELLVDLLGGIKINEEIIQGNQISVLIDNSESSSDSLEYQKIVLQVGCSRIPLIISHPNAKTLIEYILMNSITSYSILDIHSGWDHLLSSDRTPVCEFPNNKTTINKISDQNE
jgi:hypothetical protein